MPDPSTQTYDVIILGAGAAGLFCAFQAGQRGLRVAVLERSDEAGKKILISGGGRSNFTNLTVTPANFISQNPHFAKSALARYTSADFLALVESHGIAWHEKTLGQLFCDQSARQIVDLLEAECKDAGVEIFLSTDVKTVAAGYQLETSRGTFSAPRVVIATGGLSIPKMGASGFGYEIARQFGLRIVEPRPALVPFTLADKDTKRWCDLTGVSSDSVARSGNGPAFHEKLLVTHRGLSGPSILQISSYWKPGEAVSIDLLPATDIAERLIARRTYGDTSTVRSALVDFLPRRLAERWSDVDPAAMPVAAKPLAMLSNDDVAAIAKNLHQWTLYPSGTEGFEKAEVTAGGVDTDELSSKTMEAKKAVGLYFIGEVVDVTGWLGGYNFQWAWSSGYACADALR